MGERRSDRRQAWATATACAAILAAFAALTYTAARTKTATIDEPVHLVSGWMDLRQGDYRVDVGNPPLWKMWAALGNPGLTLHPGPGGPVDRPLAWAPEREPLWCSRMLFDTPGTDGDAAVQRGRAMMLAVSVALGALVAGWAYQLAGPVGAVVAVWMFAFNPTVLAHAPLMKSDLSLALCLALLGWLAWHAGRRLTWPRAIGLGGACGLAVNVKFSGVLVGPVLAILLLVRAAGPSPWPVLGQVFRSRVGRLGVAAATAAGSAVVAVGLTWACYRFRYRPAPSPTVAIDMPVAFVEVRRAAAAAALGRPATPAEVAARPQGPFLDTLDFADHHHLLPQAFLAGVLHQSAYLALWPAYLDGRRYADGRWTYYPLAILYKTPVAELLAVGVAGVIGLATARRAGWSAACVGVPAVTFAATALHARLNVGLRSVLPLFPLLDVAVGCAAAWAWHRRPRVTAVACAVLIASGATTAVTAWPDYIPFFNAAVGGPKQGLAHLADSNLDWGQDVNALAGWERAHPGVPVYADLFLSADPEFYGARVHWLFVPDAAGTCGSTCPTDRPCWP